MPEQTPTEQITPGAARDGQTAPELEALNWNKDGGDGGDGGDDDPFGGPAEPDTDKGMTTTGVAGAWDGVAKPDGQDDDAQPRNKGGRPKGSKTKRRAVGRPVASGPGRHARGSETAKAKQSHRDYGENGDFPLPKTRHFKDDNARDEIRVRAFFDFWRKAYDAGFSRRIMVYVYRIWPVMMEGHRQAGKLSDPITAEDLLRMYGVGDYNLKLNDAGNAYATVCQCTVRNVGDRNLTEHPPVLDPEGLDHMDPLNQSYIKFLASRGELRKGDDDMAGVEVVRELSNTVTGLVDRLADQTRNRDDDDRRRRPYDPEAQAAIKGMEIVQQAAVRGQEMLDQSLKRSQEINQQQGDPIAVLERATKLVREIAPAGGNGGTDRVVEIMTLMMNRDKEYYDRLFVMQAQQIAELKDSLAKTQIQNPEARPKTMLEQISEFAAIRDKMRDMLGIEDEPSSKSGGWTDHIPAILQGLTMLGAVVVNAAYNISVARTGQGTPIAPPSPDAIMTPEQAQAVQAGHMVAQPQPGQYGQPQYGQPGQQPQQPHYPSQFAQEQAEAALNQIKANGGLQTMTQFHAFLQMIEVPLLRSFQEGESGSDFAAKLIELGDNGLFGRETTGQQIYDMVTQYGLMMVSTVIKTYNPIWRVVSMTPGKWDTFLSQFFSAPAIWAQEDQDEDAREVKAREEAARAAQDQVRPKPQAATQQSGQPGPQEASGSPASAPGRRVRTPGQG